MGDKVKRYVVTETEVNKIAQVAAEKAICAYKEERKQGEKDRQKKVLNSAKMLMKNYLRFKAMAQDAVYDYKRVTDNQLKEMMELMNGNFRTKEFEILSIKEKSIRTKMIIDHVDTMLEVYKRQCEHNGDSEEARRYRVIKAMYIDEKPKTAAQIAEDEFVAERTIFRDRDIAFKRLSILFFGIDGVDFAD